MKLHIRNTTKYLFIAVWCTYEFLSLTFTLTLSRTTSLVVSPLTGLLWLYSSPSVYRSPLVVGIYITFAIGYLIFVIVGYFLGWLFFIIEKIQTPRTREILMVLFVGITICIPALLIAIGYS